MSLLSEDSQPGTHEGKRRRDKAHSLLEAHRDIYIGRARQALILHLLELGTATADDVAERTGPAPTEIDPRFLGTVPGPLARSATPQFLRSGNLSTEPGRLPGSVAIPTCPTLTTKRGRQARRPLSRRARHPSP
jgi:hypothetical protein